jgi:hypothetical protein
MKLGSEKFLWIVFFPLSYNYREIKVEFLFKREFVFPFLSGVFE